MPASLVLAQMQIVARDETPVGDLTSKIQERVAEAGIDAIGDRRFEPLEDDGIAFQEQLQGLAEVPAIDVEHAVHFRFDDVAALPEGQIVLERPDEDEAAIIIAVRRGKSPGPAAALDRERYRHLMVALYFGEPRIDPRDGRFIHARIDGPQSHAVGHLRPTR